MRFGDPIGQTLVFLFISYKTVNVENCRKEAVNREYIDLNCSSVVSIFHEIMS